MQKTLQVLKAVALVALILVAASVCLVLLQASSAIKQIDAVVATTASGLDSAIEQSQKTILLSGKLINDGRLAADNLNSAALDERFYFENQLPPMMLSTRRILGNVDTATAGVAPLLDEVTKRAHALKPIEKNAARLEAAAADVLTGVKPAIADTDTAVQHLDALIASSAVTDSLANIDKSTKSLADAAVQGDAILADGHIEADKYTHPPKKKLGFWGATEAAGDWVRHFLPPIF